MKFSAGFKLFIVQLYNKFRKNGAGHARAAICKLFHIPARTVSSWVSKQGCKLNQRSDRHGGWQMPLHEVKILSSANQTVVSVPNPSPSVSASFGFDTGRSGLQCRTRALQAVTLAARQTTTRSDTFACVPAGKSLVAITRSQKIRPHLSDTPSRLWMMSGLQLPRSIAEAERLHTSRHSEVYTWQWPIHRSIDELDVATYVIKLYADRLAYLYEKAAFVRLTTGFCRSVVHSSVSALFCFPVAETSFVMGDGDASPSLVFEHFPGMHLHDLSRCFRQSFDCVFDVMRLLLTAASALHKAGIVHCDIKPGNVLVRIVAGSVKVKLIDFSCAHELGSVGSRAGTLGYRALEVLGVDGRRFRWAAAQDVFSCAVTMCSFIAGKHVIEVAEKGDVGSEIAAVKSFVHNVEESLLSFSNFQYWFEVDVVSFRRFCSLIIRMVRLPRITVAEVIASCTT